MKFDIFKFDITEIIKINHGADKEMREASKFQVEIEIINKYLNENEIMDKIKNQLIIIMNLINS